MTRVLKRIVLAVLLTLFFVVAAAAAASMYLSTEKGARRLLDAVNTLYPGQIRGSRIFVDLLRQEVQIDDAVVLAPGGREVLRAKKAFVKTRLGLLAARRLVFESIRLDEPVLILELDEDGWLTIEAAFVEKTPGESPIDVFIESLTCTGGTLAYRDRKGRTLVRFEKTSLAMNAAFAKDSLISICSPATHAFLFASGKAMDLGTGKASLRIMNDSIGDIAWNSVVGSTRIGLAGTVTDMAKTAVLDLTLRIEGESARIQDMIGLGGKTSGPITATIRVTGPYQDPDVAFDIASPGLSLEGYAVGPARLTGRIHERVAKIEEARVRTPAGTLTVTGSVDATRAFPDGLFEGMKEEDAIAYDFSITTAGLSLDSIPGSPPWLSGMLHGRARITGAGLSTRARNLSAAFEAQGPVSAPRVLSGRAVRIAGRITISGDTLEAKSLEIEAQGMSAGIRGKTSLSRRTIDAHAGVWIQDIGSIARPLGTSASGMLEADLIVSGTWDSPSVAINASARRVSLGGAPMGDAVLDAFLEPSGTLEVHSCTVTNQAAILNARGTIVAFNPFPRTMPDPAFMLDMDFSGVDPSIFRKDLPVQGSVEGTIRLSGTLRRPEAVFSLSGRDMRAFGIPFESALAHGSFTEGTIALDRVELTQKGSQVTGILSLGILDRRGRPVADPSIALNIKGQGVSLSDFHPSLKGTLDIEGSVEGTIRHPLGDASLEAQRIDLGFQTFTSASVRVHMDGDFIHVEPATATIAPGQTINAKGFFTTSGGFEFTMGTPGIAFKNLDFMKTHEAIAGTLFFHASGHGTIDNPTISGRVAAAEVSFMNTPLSDMTLAFELRGRTLDIEGDWDFHLTAHHDLDTGMFEAEALFAETNLAPVFAIAGRETLSGRLTGQVAAKGKASSIRDCEITAQISSLEILHEGETLLRTTNASATYGKGMLELPQTRISLARGGFLNIRGSGDVVKDLVLDIDGSIPASTLGLFREELSDASGTVRVASTITTVHFTPRITGNITLEDLAWTIPSNLQRIHSTSGRITLSGNRVSTDDIKGRLDTGTFQLGGDILFDGLTPVSAEIVLDAKALPVAIPDTMDLTMDIEASWEMKKGSSRLFANATVLEGLYYRDMKVDLFSGVIGRILPARRPSEAGGMPLISWRPLASSALDVTVRKRGSVKVENNMADLEINPDLRIMGTLERPVVNGRIAITEGVVTFQNNEFTVTRGVVDFLDPTRTRANVDITAETQVRDWDITLSLQGEMDALKLSLTSQPPEEPADIVSLLIVGKTSRELTQEQASVSVSPAGMIAELVTSTYGRQIKKTTTVDIFELKASDFATSTGGESMTLIVGKELSRRMTVRYEMTTRDAQTLQKAVAEYKILENLLVNGYQETDGVFGVDLLYSRRFR